MPRIPGCYLSWDVSVASIQSRTKNLIKQARSIYDAIGCNTKQPSINSIALDIRDASCESARQISDLEVELEMRKDVFDKFVTLQASLDFNTSPEIKRYVNWKVREGRRNGLHLGADDQAKIGELSKKERKLCIEFQRALNEENTLLTFGEKDLVGCPQDFIDSLTKLPEGKRQISLKYPHYFPASEKASNPETRRQLEYHFNSRCKDTNVEILKELMDLRKQRSALLDFPNHADFVLQIRMAKQAVNVSNFLSNLGDKLQHLYRKDYKRLLELKEQECTELDLPFDGKIQPWDLRYYSNKAKEIDYNVDQQKLKKYFPVHVVKAGVLRLYQHLLGLTFARVETDNVWHSDVEMYSVSDTATKQLLGYFYLDIHPREGKYGHAAVFTLQNGCRRLPRPESSPEGDEGAVVDAVCSQLVKVTGSDSGLPSSERQVAIAAMVANFTGPSECTPVPHLLHSEVEVFFHEFGHLMHAICAQTDTSLFSGTHVESDFVECPSQMLENWVWTEDGINALIGPDAEQMPEKLMQDLLKSRFANAGLFYTRQVLLASFDQAIHTDRFQDDPDQVFKDLSEKLSGISPTPGTSFPATFGHMAGGYDSRYYGYAWSEVFSADLFESRFRNAPDGGCMSRSVGREYRDKILLPGGSKDANDMLVDFLRRPPSDQPFFNLIK